ncbi:GPW/gp25 family protein [Anaerotruncus rubiinfantis]|uniref:GPW/gp25 family protein n=1 Tax=Anaerotruncus rubiinfantis TaxID=1720200 RepID=UPI0034A485AA
MIVVSSVEQIDWYAKGKDRIAQNVRNLINTFRYEVAYHRTMGLPADVIDRPTPEAMAELSVEVWQLIARYEPRANIQNVTCTPNESGEIKIEVVLA